MTAIAERPEAMPIDPETAHRTAHRPPEITEPGVYEISEEIYFGSQHALSCSGAKLLLPPSCPAKFFYAQDHPVYKDVWDFGSAAHKLVLGSGPELVVVPYDSWRTNDAKAMRTEARAAGKIPMLEPDCERVRDMADAIRRHSLANALLNPDYGHAEQSLFWRDPETGILLRSRFDVLRDKVGGPLMIPDYKTADSADPDTFARSAANFNYHMQDAFYSDGAAALGYHKPRVLFVVQEKEPPYLVSVVELDYESRQAGRRRYRRAIGIYLKCVAKDEWPGYVDDDQIRYISLPAWAIRREDFS